MAFGKLLSDRVKKRKGSELDSERYNYISLDNTEPDFGNPSSANGLMSSTQSGYRRFIETSTGLEIDSATSSLLISTTGVAPGSYGSIDKTPVITINPEGQITSALEELNDGIKQIAFDPAQGKIQILTHADNQLDVNISLDAFTTDDLTEGSANLYHTIERVRSAISAAGDLSYDSNTGVFSFDVEEVYTKANFDSDFNMALDEAALGGTGLTFDSANNTLNITDTGVIANTYGSASEVPVLKINAQGQVDSAGTVTVAGVSSVQFDSASFNYTINTADGGVFTKMIHTRKPGLAAGEHGSASKVPIITINEYGLVDSIGTTNVAGVSSTSFDSATGTYTINTADGNVFNTPVFTRQLTRTALVQGEGINYDSASGVISVADSASINNLSGLSLNYSSLNTGLMTGPDTILIDPAAIGDATGTVRILGNLIVEGTETTINSTQVSINDKAIVIADSAADSAGLNGGGIIWGGTNIADKPSFKYNHTSATFNANRRISANLIGDVTGQVSSISNFTTDDLTEGASNEYYTKARVDSDIAASINDSDNVVNITINQTIGSVVDSAYVLARVEEAPFLDSNDLVSGISNIVSDSATFSKITVPPVSNGGIILQDSTGDALTISNRLQSNPLIEADAPLTIKNFYKTSFINTDGTIRAIIGSSNGSAGRVILYGPNQRSSFETTSYGAFISDKLKIGSSGVGGSTLEVDSATIPRITLQESDYTDGFGATDGNFTLADLGAGRVDFGYQTTFGPAIEMYNKHSSVTGGSRRGRIGLTYGGEDGLGDIRLTHRTSSTWIERGRFDAFGNFQMDGKLTADSAAMVNLTLTGKTVGLHADSATIDNMVGTATNAAKLNNEGPAYYLAYENFTGIPFVFDSNQTVEIVDSNLSFNGFLLRDAVRGAFGTDRDLEIYHDNANAYIDNTKGHLYIRNNVDDDDGSNIILQAKSGENGIIIADDAQVRLYYNGNERLATSSAGVDINGTLNSHTIPGGTGTFALTSDLNFIDSALALAFLSTLDSSDVSTIVSETVTQSFVNNLNVDADTLDNINSTSFLRSDADDEFTGTITGVSDGTNPTIGIRGNGPNFIRFFDDANGSNTTNAVDIVYRRTPNDLLIERSGSANKIAEFGGDDGHAALYFDNSKKLETNTYGVTVTGVVSGDSASFTGSGTFGKYVIEGNGNIKATTGDINLEIPAGQVFNVKNSGNTNLLQVAGTGDITLKGDNYNAVWDASENSLEFADDAKAKFGNVGDLSIYHSGNTNYIDNNIPQSLHIRSNGLVGQEGIIVYKNNAVALHFNGDQKLSTRSNGIEVTGTVNADSATFNRVNVDSATFDTLTITGGSSAVTFTSNAVAEVLKLGNNSISQVHTLYINDPGPNEGIIWTNGNTKIYESPNDLTSNGAGNLQLVHGDIRRLTVDNYGADVNGRLAADSATLTGGITGTHFQGVAVASENKFRYWNSATVYTSGFASGYTFGGLGDGGGDGYSINWTNSNTASRGFIWDDASHTKAQGAMALTTNGKLTVAHSARIGYGETDTTTPGATHRLDVSGSFHADSITLNAGTSVNEFSTDGTLAGNSNDAVPTEAAVKTYVDNNAGTGSLDSADVTQMLSDGSLASNSVTVNAHSLVVSGGFSNAETRFSSMSFTRTTTAQSSPLNFNATTYSGGELTIVATRGSDRHITKLMFTHDGSTPIATEYGTVTTNGILATYDFDFSSPNVRLQVASTSATSTSFKVHYVLYDGA